MDKIQESVIEIKNKLKKFKEIFAVILFGSVARGDYSIRHSDIDILIILKDPKSENKIRKVLEKINIKFRVRIHPEFQTEKIEKEDETLLCKMFEEGKILFNKGFFFMNINKLGLNAFRLYDFDTKKTPKVKRVMLSRALHGRTKKAKGIIDNISIIESGKGGLLVRKDKWKDIENLFKIHNVEYRIKKVLYA